MSAFRICIDFDAALSVGNFFVTRRFAKSKSELFEEFGGKDCLRVGSIERRDAPGMSMNLIGDFFLPEDSYFVVKGSGAQIWNGKEIFLSEHLSGISKQIEGSLVFFSVRNLHNAKFPYKRPIDKKSDKEITKFFESIESVAKKLPSSTAEVVYEVVGTTKIMHKPTNLNYWHVEFGLFDSMGDEFDRDKLNAAWKKKACEDAINHLLVASAVSEIQTFDTLSRTYFVGNS